MLAAFGHVWSALEWAESWPDGLRAQAAGLIVGMLRLGTRHETAERMTDAEARDFAAMLRRFLAEAERAELARTMAALRRRAAHSHGRRRTSVRPYTGLRHRASGAGVRRRRQ